MSSLDPGKAERQAKRAAGQQQQAIQKQKQLEQVKLAEEEDVIGRKKMLAKAGGRSLLVAKPTAQNTNLGGL